MKYGELDRRAHFINFPKGQHDFLKKECSSLHTICIKLYKTINIFFNFSIM